MTRHEGTLRVALAFSALLASLSGVIWRQSRALELLRQLDETRSRRAAVESDKSRLTARIQYLESRGRISDVAAARWSMRVPASDEEFVILLRPERDSVATRSLRLVRAGMIEGVAALVGERE
jgi:cell division protein FtsL